MILATENQQPIAPNLLPIDMWTPSGADADFEFEYIDIASIDRDSKRITATTTKSATDAPSRARQIVKSNDVLVSTVRPNLNAVALVPPELDGAIASTGFCVLRCDPKKLNSGYLFHWVRTSQFVGNMVRQATGASYPAVADRIVKQSTIPVLPLAEQERIAAILDKADAIRRKRQEATESVESLLDATVYQLFGDVPARSSRYPISPLESLLIAMNGKSTRDILSDEETSIPIYGGNGKMGWAVQALYEQPVVVVGRVGQQCGITHLTDGPSWVTDNAIAVQVTDPDTLNLEFLEAALHRSTLGHDVRYIDLPYINQSMIRDLPLPLPPIEQQLQFVRHKHKILSALESQRRHLDDSNGLFHSLVQRAFRGEL